MNQINKTFSIVLAAALCLMAGSCKKSELQSFIAAPAVNFTGTTDEYSFLGNPSNEYIMEIPVRVTGDSLAFDRQFSATVVRDTFTTAADGQYEIVGGVIKANRFRGTLSVKVFNSPELSTKTNSLKLKLTDSKDLKAGNVEQSTFVIKWSNKVVIPSWTYYRIFFCATSSTAVYKLIVQTTGLKTFTAAQYRSLLTPGATALGTQFGDYVKQWNLDHPNDHLKHDDGTKAGQEIIPVYYTHSKYD